MVPKSDSFKNTLSSSFDSPYQMFFNNEIHDSSKLKNFNLPITFQKASQLPKFTFDICELDSTLEFLSTNQKICIVGNASQILIERICVRAQLDSSQGGLDSKVLLIDGGNNTDFYKCVSFAQKYSIDPKKILGNIITCRAFTAYQIADLILTKLNPAISDCGVKIVIITDLLHFFLDGSIDSDESIYMIKSIVQQLSLIRDCLVIISLPCFTKLDEYVFEISSVVIKTNMSGKYIAIDIVNHNTNSFVVKKSALDAYCR